MQILKQVLPASNAAEIVYKYFYESVVHNLISQFRVIHMYDQ